MSTLVKLALCLSVVLSGIVCTPVEKDGALGSAVHVTIEAVPDLAAFQRAHPELTIEPLMSRSETSPNDSSSRQQIVYTVGAHTSGERLVGLSSDSASWATSQDVRLDLQYPTAGVGAVVTYVEVVVNQSSSQGKGYIVSGGIGQRFIRLVIEAYSTTYFTYTAAIYGF
uniref:Uncharacterized protein n=1 Tax=Anopheles farauti TaxID=69004 RepID=A0A182Q704_9DIPT